MTTSLRTLRWVPRALALLVAVSLGASARAADGGRALAPGRDGGSKFFAGTERDRECLVCHAGVGEEDAPKLDLGAYERSVHGPYGCISCHADVEDPDLKHELPEQDLKHVDCARCHTNGALDGGLEAELAPGIDRTNAKQADVKKVIEELRESVHFSKRAEFTCARCHNPHTIRFGMTRGEKIDHNQVCLRCHASEAEFRAFVDESPQDLDKAHAWLPNPQVHWRTARCLDCHTSTDPSRGPHLILPKEQAVQNCEACHTRESLLTWKPGRFNDTEQTRTGFLNRGLVGKAYVIGATRNRYLDLIGIALSTATFLGILGHALIRIIAARLNRRRGATQGGHPS